LLPQALLRGVAPNSFPFALGPEPAVATGLRRLVVVDENVERIYGAQIREVRLLLLLLLLLLQI
jgi:hypothetical protein